MATTRERRPASDTDAWRAEAYEATPERQGELFSTISGLENDPLYTPDVMSKRMRSGRPRRATSSASAPSLASSSS